MRKVFTFAMAFCLATLFSCGNKPASTEPDVECGGFGEPELLSAEDSLVFKTALGDSLASQLSPVIVSKQVVGGMNYNFRCEQMNSDSTMSSVEVCIYDPMESDRKPEITSISKLADADETGYLVRVGEMAPDFIVTLASGETVRLSELRGKVVMLQFTASWCSVCRKEMPFIESDIWQKHKDDVDFFLMGIDRDEPLETVNKFSESVGITYPLALDPGANVYVRYALKQSGITRNVLIDREGKIVKLTRLYNEEEFSSLVQMINEMLAE